jgi:hypothetical protein
VRIRYPRSIALVPALSLVLGASPVLVEDVRREPPVLVGESPMRGGIDTKIILRKGIGPRVLRLRAGRYKIYVRVKLPDHNFHLIGPGINRSTPRRFVGQLTWIVNFRPGVYTYQSDHMRARMRETFRVY